MGQAIPNENTVQISSYLDSNTNVCATGINAVELAQNPRLTSFVAKDLKGLRERVCCYPTPRISLGFSKDLGREIGISSGRMCF